MADTAQTFRIVFWRVDFETRGPGQALAQIERQKPNTQAIADTIALLDPSILVLSGIDYDMTNQTLLALRDLIDDRGTEFPHVFAPRPNAGFDSGLDLNGDGRRHQPDDAHGYGEYAGARALAVLSRFPFAQSGYRDFTEFLWRDLPDALLYTGAHPEQLSVHRLSSVAHFALPVVLPDGTELSLMVYQSGPPVFGDHPDRNRNRNHDETAFWLNLLNNQLPLPKPNGPFVLIGGSNLDPYDGDGIHSAMHDLLAHPKLQDPKPSSPGAAAQADPEHRGPAALDTVDWDAPQGNLRVAYILPSTDLSVTGAGVLWPTLDGPVAELLTNSGTAHKPVWLDVRPN